MARRHLWRNDVVRSHWRTRHPLLRFLYLHEAVTLPFVVAISDPTYLSAIIHLHFGDCLSGTLFSSRWSAMEFRGCQPPCARFIAREDPHSKCIKCLGFSHARDAVYGTSKCKICDDFRLITLRSRLEDCERESSIFPRRASSTSAAPRKILVIEDTLASHLSPSLAPSWKSRPLLPSKPCRTTSALIGKSYIVAGQAGMALHTMAILQAYQADVLK